MPNSPVPLAATDGRINHYSTLRLRLAKYFHKYPVPNHKFGHPDEIPAGIAEWAMDLLLYNEEPAPYCIETVAHQKRNYLSIAMSTTAYCIECDLVYFNLPVGITNSIVHTCQQCSQVELDWRVLSTGSYNPFCQTVV